MRIEVKTMQTSKQLLKPTITLAMGFALGLGAAHYFSAVGNEGKATAPPPSETAKTLAAPVLSTTLNAPIKLATQLGPPTRDGAGINTPSEDISLSETADASRKELATTEPSPEELAKNQPIDLAATPRLSLQETDNLENKLRLESENTARIPLERNEGLLEHERL